MLHTASPPPTVRRRRSTLLTAVLIVGATLIGLVMYESLAWSSAAIGSHRAGLGPADGVVSDGVTVFDDVPAVANLDRELVAALRRAAADTSGDGVTFYVNSGWRSPAYQNRLLREAVATYGSGTEARRRVATAETSAHVSGDAVDVGSDAAAWLSDHGAAYGLCQIYRNESWHFELRRDAVDNGCPAMYDDPTHDPRMQR
jgi:D-alanyl-D-alanine carboxypeptidase